MIGTQSSSAGSDGNSILGVRPRPVSIEFSADLCDLLVSEFGARVSGSVCRTYGADVPKTGPELANSELEATIIGKPYYCLYFASSESRNNMIASTTE